MTRFLKGKKILITAGPTREFIDPVRYLSNASSGRMGYAIAEEAQKGGAQVTIVSGPSSLTPAKGVRLISVITSEEMYRAVMKEYAKAHFIIMVAAVADYRPKMVSRIKIKKKSEDMVLHLVKTRDILKELGLRKKRGQILIGFAAETDHLIEHGRKKLREKNLDAIIINRVGLKTGSGFESDYNAGVILSANGVQMKIPRMLKKQMAIRIVEFLKNIPRRR